MPGLPRLERLRLLAARAAGWLLGAGFVLGLLGSTLNNKLLQRVADVLSVVGLSAGLAWLGATVYVMRRSGSTCLLATYLSMGLWALTPWGLYAQAKQLAGEARLRRKALDSVEGYEPPLVLIPPFCGCWVVARGGVSREDSHSWSLVGQRYAYDLVAADDAEKLENLCRYRRLSDWATYGAPVAAAAPGRVVRVVDGVPDNTPVGWIKLGARYPEGNHVVIKHLPGVYTLYAHLRRGSIRVRPGDEVEAGQVIGEAGNSGMSTAPHLHFQVMDTGDPLYTVSLPAYMRYRSPGGVVEGYPGRGTLICGFC